MDKPRDPNELGALWIKSNDRGDYMTGNIGGLVSKVGNMIRSRGFNDQQAEAIVSAAIDPRQTDALIEMLAVLSGPAVSGGKILAGGGSCWKMLASAGASTCQTTTEEAKNKEAAATTSEATSL
mgnify:CR=1 FL=1